MSGIRRALTQDMQLPRSAVGALVTATFWARLLAGVLRRIRGGPTGAGLPADRAGWGAAWLVIAVAFTGAAAAAGAARLVSG